VKRLLFNTILLQRKIKHFLIRINAKKYEDLSAMKTKIDSSIKTNNIAQCSLLIH